MTQPESGGSAPLPQLFADHASLGSGRSTAKAAPNLQQLPLRSPEGRRIRAAFRPSPINPDRLRSRPGADPLADIFDLKL